MTGEQSERGTGTGAKDGLRARIERSLGRDIHASVARFAEMLAAEARAEAVVFYGSNLRTGELEGVLDFYLLMAGPQQERIWPRVSYHEREIGDETLRAKVATMAMDTFVQAAAGKFRDTTIWARFVQPSALIWAEDDVAHKQVLDGLVAAAITAAELAAALGPREGVAEDFWRALFRATYRAEFRVEKPGREDSILAVNRPHFEGLLPVALDAADIRYKRKGARLSVSLPDQRRRRILRWWRVRRRWGKPLNVVRLFKASTTFEGAARYAAWKLQRHTGVEVEVTPWREKHPILAAPGVLLKVWRERRGR